MGVFLNLFTGSNRGVPVSAANPLPVTGTFAPPEGGATETEQQAQTDLLEAIEAAAEATANAVSSSEPAETVGFLKTIAATPTVESTLDYASGDVIGGVMTFAAILRADTETAYAVAIRLTSKVAAASMAAIDAYIFNANPSASTTIENGAFTLADADRAKLRGKIKITEWGVVGSTVSEAYAEARVPITGAAADDVYVVMVARGAINLASTSDLTVELTVDQN